MRQQGQLKQTSFPKKTLSNAKLPDVLRICAHETSHFFFYRKIKEVNFAVQPNEQHLWLISEVLVPLLFRGPHSIDILGRITQGSYVCKQPLIKNAIKSIKKD